MVRRLFTMLVLTLLCAGLYAQTSAETALPLAEGENSYTFDEAGQNVVFFKYTAGDETGVLLEFSIPERVSYTVTDSETSSYVNGMYSDNKTVTYPVKKNQTLIIQVGCYDVESVTFTVSMTPANVDGGASCDDAIEMTDSFFVPNHGQGYDYAYTYLSYSATETGVLVVCMSAYPMEASVAEGCDGTFVPVTFNYDSEKKNFATISVYGGKNYILKLKLSSSSFCTTYMTYPEIGSSCNMPFESTDGDNVLPAEIGSYWYRYVAENSGFVVVSSEGNLPGGSISVYNSCSETMPFASVSSYFGLRFRVTGGNTYLFNIDKTETTAGDETFQVRYEEEAPGDSEQNPVVVAEAGDFDAPLYNGDYYYSVTMPEDRNLLLVVDASENSFYSEETLFGIYPQGSPYSIVTAADYLRYETEPGGTYIVKWQCREGKNGFGFSIGMEEIKQGDVCSYPLDAVQGSNMLDMAEVKYYAYTPEKEGWLVIDTDVDINVQFMRDCSGYSFYESVKDGRRTKTRIQPGERYIIKFENIQYDTEFTLTEEEYKEGESCDNPIIVETGSYDVPEEVCDIWYRYDVTEDCVAEVSTTVSYEVIYEPVYMTSGMTVRFGSCDGNPTGIGESMRGKYAVKAGTAIYVNLKTLTAQRDKKITFNSRQAEEGEICSNPIMLKPGETELSGKATRSVPIWYGISLAPGSFSISSASYFQASLVMDCDTEESVAETKYDYETGGYVLSYQITEPQKYIIKLVDGGYGSPIPVTIVGEPLAVEDVQRAAASVYGGEGFVRVEAQQACEVEIYDTDGVLLVSGKVAGSRDFAMDRGIYFVVAGSEVVKVVVR